MGMVGTAQRICRGSDSTHGGFWRLVFCLLCRYDALCGPGKDEGQGLHAAVPPAVLATIAEHLTIYSHLGEESRRLPPALPTECYASPLNCRAHLVGALAPGLFGSVCADVDILFGSLGSF